LTETQRLNSVTKGSSKRLIQLPLNRTLATT
jgi:hypothetical protein